MIKPLDILQKYWGYPKFRDPQEEIIASVLQKRNTIALLPTGGGKSICFQIPTLLLDGICIVISPMVSLMKDQVDSLQKKGIKAVTINAGMSQDEMITIFDNLKFGNYKFLYVSPERLLSKFIQKKVKELNINLIAVDEAHCISEWGHDFRPSYRHIRILKELHPHTACIALTATATKKVLIDISENLGMNDVAVFKKSFFRKELAYQVFHLEDKLGRLLQIFKKTKTPAIVYVRTRKRTKEIASFLNANKFSSSYYHGGMLPAEKEAAFENWMNEKTKIMVATNAFGMGIDKSNVGIVIHLDIPYSIENFVQEAGRAGRNGKKSFSVVLQNNNDLFKLREQLQLQTPSIKEIKKTYKQLNQFFMISNGELPLTPFYLNNALFCDRYNLTLKKTEYILRILANNGIIEINNSYKGKSSIQFLVNSRQLLKYKHQSKDIHKVIDTILRNYTGVFDTKTNIDEFIIAKKSGITSTRIKGILEKLNDEQIINYTSKTNNAELYFLVPREDDLTINSISKSISSYTKQQYLKVESLITFIQNDTVCRSTQLLSYFGENNMEDCGICDVCLRDTFSKTDISKLILDLLHKKKLLSSIEIQEQLEVDQKDILIHLRHLLAEDKIAINNYNKYYIK
ncbi:MAG: RecQ family ATP-dependent DNA helicase [Flavobacteriaceae bacterium]